MRTADITKTELRIVTEKSDKIHFNTSLGVLLSHNGFRPGSVHTFIGISSGGKSTLVRSLIIDVLKNLNALKKVFLWLSEESYLDFVKELGRSGYSDKEKLKNLHVQSELDLGEMPAGQMFNLFSENCKDKDFIFLDNLTTSEFYEPLRPQEQGKVAKKLKAIAERLQVPMVLICHTSGAVTENIPRLIDQNDVRGGKGIVNISQFFYVLQRFNIGETIFPTIRITKHRGQNTPHKLFYLKYNTEKRAYDGDRQISFMEFKKVFKQRNLL